MDRFEYAKKRILEGASIRQIGRELEVDHSTISYWIKNNFSSGTVTNRLSIERIQEVCNAKSAAYSYILGCYLGDGHISQLPRTQRLRLFSGTSHPSIIEDQVKGLNRLFDNVVNNKKCNNQNMEIITVHNTQLDVYFPQHGLGKKHERDVSLKPWQQEIVDKEPECFIKGLIDTDGSSYIRTNIVNGVARTYPSYSFTNKSKDIMNMCQSAFKTLGIEVNRTTRKDGVSRFFLQSRKDVDILDKIYTVAEEKLSK